MTILAIDPGNTKSGWVLFSQNKILGSGISENEDIKMLIRQSNADVLAIEMIACYGMAVGKEIFDTCVWIGRFCENWDRSELMVFRKDVKLHLCQSIRAKDSNIRQALIDRFGDIGTKKEPGTLYGIRSHCWSALAVAVTASDKLESGDENFIYWK